MASPSKHGRVQKVAHQDPIMSEQVVVAVLTAVVTMMLTLAGLIRRLSRDKTELVKDRAETDVIELLSEQRTTALEEVRQLKLDLELIAEENEAAIEKIKLLTTQNAQLKSQVALLNTLVGRLAGKSIPLPDLPDPTVNA